MDRIITMGSLSKFNESSDESISGSEINIIISFRYIITKKDYTELNSFFLIVSYVQVFGCSSLVVTFLVATYYQVYIIGNN